MRPTKDEYFLNIAKVVATRSTCIRRKVGAVLVSHLGHIIGTGYNGVAEGMPHCIDEPCEGSDAPSGKSLDMCLAIHAEQNALLQCHDVRSIDTIYCTASPCITCVKLLLNTSCKRIVFDEEYPHTESKHIWVKSNRLWISSRV